MEDNGRKTCHFRYPVTGGGTFDDSWAVERAEFVVLPLRAAGDGSLDLVFNRLADVVSEQVEMRQPRQVGGGRQTARR